MALHECDKRCGLAAQQRAAAVGARVRAFGYPAAHGTRVFNRSVPVSGAAELSPLGGLGDTAEVRVVIPDEDHAVLRFLQDDLPGIGVINQALESFRERRVFRWHLSIMVHFENLVEQGMPSPAEVALVERLSDELDALLKADPRKPNALFLGRLTWNRTQELLYRVHDPEVANQSLQQIINGREHARGFDFRMDDDPDWKLASWHLGEASS